MATSCDERAQYEAVRRHLRPNLQCVVAIYYELGWRKREVLALERRHVDLDAGTLRLAPGTTKNSEGRVVYLSEGLKAELAAQLERVDALERETGRIIPALFPHPTNGRRHRRGDPIEDFRKAWATACSAAGCPAMTRHDFRRTAVRDLVNMGTPERDAMKITGHKTRAVFDRYHIVSPADLQEAARRRDALQGGTPRAATVIPLKVSGNPAP